MRTLQKGVLRGWIVVYQSILETNTPAAGYARGHVIGKDTCCITRFKSLVDAQTTSSKELATTHKYKSDQPVLIQLDPPPGQQSIRDRLKYFGINPRWEQDEDVPRYRRSLARLCVPSGDRTPSYHLTSTTPTRTRTSASTDLSTLPTRRQEDQIIPISVPIIDFICNKLISFNQSCYYPTFVALWQFQTKLS